MCEAASAALQRLAEDARPSMAGARRDVAQALGTIANKDFHPLLVPMMYDADREVATEAIRSAGKLGAGDYPLRAAARRRCSVTGC